MTTTAALGIPMIEQRADARHVIGSFVVSGSESEVAGIDQAARAVEGFMVVDLSHRGMSLLRVGGTEAGRAEAGRAEGGQGLDGRFAWIAVPLPERGQQILALAEVVRRERFGPLEWLGLCFKDMADADREVLDAYLDERGGAEAEVLHLPVQPTV